MTHKLRSEMSSQKIDTFADIRFGSLTLLEGFVILKGSWQNSKENIEMTVMGQLAVMPVYVQGPQSAMRVWDEPMKNVERHSAIL